jgi:hypothetical protein
VVAVWFSDRVAVRDGTGLSMTDSVSRLLCFGLEGLVGWLVRLRASAVG